MAPRRIALLAFPGITLLDLIGVYDVLRRVGAMGVDPEVRCRVLGTETPVADEHGLRLVPEAVYEDLAGYDLLVVPGGHGTRELAKDARCIEYLRSWGEARPIASVCTGSILLGAAGHLAGKRATTHHRAYGELAPYCAEVVRDRRVVDEGRVVTAGGVACALDLGVHLVERFWGADARRRIADQMALASLGSAL